MITGMNHAVLYVRDARRQQAFYTDVLGFETSSRPPRQFRVHAGAGLGQPPPPRVLHDRFGSGRFPPRPFAGRPAPPRSEVPTLDDLERHRNGSPTPEHSRGASTTASTRASMPMILTASSSR